jgi:hypothetical protein
MTKKIFTFGDGYATNHLWPEWPAIIQALYPDYQHKNFAAIGAGNEYINNCIVDAHQQDNQALFLVQWAQFSRFDKLLQDDTWDNIINTDPVYHFNRVGDWWISSASRQPEVRHYHKFYVQGKQAQLRSYNYIYMSAHLLNNNAIFFSTGDPGLTTQEQQKLLQVKWAPDMLQYAQHERFQEIRQNEVQPSPQVHFFYVEEFLLPLMPAQPDQERLKELKTRIFQHKWRAYDPDRESTWADISNI